MNQEHDEMLTVLNLADYSGILSHKNTWYLLNEDSGIWFTESIPGSGSMPASADQQYDLYTKFNFCMCFGKREDKLELDHHERNLEITTVRNMCRFIYNDPRFVKGENDNIYFCVNINNRIEKQLFLGTVVFTTGLDEDSYMLRKFKMCDKEHPIRLQLGKIREYNKQTNSLDELFSKADKPLEDAFKDAFLALYNQYWITNRGGDIDNVLQRLSGKLF